MRTIFTTHGVAATFAVALMVVGCNEDGGNEGSGPGDGPAPPGAQAPARDGAAGASSTDASSVPPGAQPPPSAQVLARGEFVNKSESGTGMALLVVGADNVPFLRLENIAISSRSRGTEKQKRPVTT